MSRRRLTRLQAEAGARKHLRSRLAPTVACAVWHDRIFKDLAAYYDDADPATTLSEVEASLTSRVADEIRVMAWAAERAYLLPAMTLGSSVIEIAFTAAFVARSPARAAKWHGHTKGYKAPWSVSEIVADVVIGDGGSQTQANNAYGHYQVLCTGKHHNPLLTLKLPAAPSGERHVLEVDPSVAPRRWNSLAGVMVFALLHVQTSLVSLSKHGHFPPSIVHRLPTGKALWAEAAASLLRRH